MNGCEGVEVEVRDGKVEIEFYSQTGVLSALVLSVEEAAVFGGRVAGEAMKLAFKNAKNTDDTN